MSNSVIPPTPDDAGYAKTAVADLEWLTADDPTALFERWMGEAGQAEINDPHAMTLATVDKDGLPDARIVLLKGHDESGFTFYTNSQSAKGTQLQSTGKAALCFHWKSLGRQVRVRGMVSPVEGAAADTYFASRARGSQIGAWASQQSRPVSDRKTLMQTVKDKELEFEGRDVPRPDHWFGWRVAPTQIEFWQNGPYRVHDRIVFTKQGGEPGSTDWIKTRLFP